MTKSELLTKHHQAKVYYIAECKQQSCINEAISRWSNSRDSQKAMHIARLERRLSKSKIRQQELSKHIEELESQMKSQHVKFEPVFKKLF